MNRVLITGDRHWDCPGLAESIVNRLVARYGPGITLVHGAGTGVDAAFADAAEAAGLVVEAHPADWSQGKAGGPRRNELMVERGADLCIAVHRSIRASRGTKDCARRAIRAGIPTYLIDADEGVPRRLELADLE